MKKHYNLFSRMRKPKLLIRLVPLLLIFFIFMSSCEDEDFDIPIEESIKTNDETISLEEAKSYFEQKQESNLIANKSNGLVVDPDWTSLSHESLSNTSTKITRVDASINRKGDYKSELFFVKIDGEMKNVIYTLYKDSISNDGNVINGRFFLNETNGLFIDGYIIEDGLITKRYVVRRNSKDSDSIGNKKDSMTWPGDDTVDGGELDEVFVYASSGGDGGGDSSHSWYAGSNRGSMDTSGSGVDNSHTNGVNTNYGGSGGSGSNGTGLTARQIKEEAENLTVNPPDDCPDGQVKDKNGNCVTPCDTSKDDLKKVFPNTNDAKLKEIADAINKLGKDFGIDTKEKMQHFLAQAGHESTNYAGIEFAALTENLNYQWKKLGTKDYWGRYFNPITNPTADPTKENPNDYKRSSTSNYVDIEKFANYVYNDANRGSRGQLGNNNTGDGYKYRGRGIIQLTGKHNYEQFNSFYQENYDSNADLVANPDLISTNMDIAVISALWFFKNNVLSNLDIDSNTSVDAVTKIVNGGKKGLKHRKELHKKSKTNIDCL